MVGESLEGFSDHGVAGDDRGQRHSRHNRARKIPRRNHSPNAQRNVNQIIFLALHRRHRLRSAQPQHFPPIKFTEINRLRDIGIGFRPGLAHFINQHRGEIEFPLPQQIAHAKNKFRALFRRHALPFLKRFSRRIDRADSPDRQFPSGKFPVPVQDAKDSSI